MDDLPASGESQVAFDAEISDEACESRNAVARSRARPDGGPFEDNTACASAGAGTDSISLEDDSADAASREVICR
jgi:hypothetical protein